MNVTSCSAPWSCGVGSARSSREFQPFMGCVTTCVSEWESSRATGTECQREAHFCACSVAREHGCKHTPTAYHRHTGARACPVLHIPTQTVFLPPSPPVCAPTHKTPSVKGESVQGIRITLPRRGECVRITHLDALISQQPLHLPANQLLSHSVCREVRGETLHTLESHVHRGALSDWLPTCVGTS